jgi:hypothetical protein
MALRRADDQQLAGAEPEDFLLVFRLECRADCRQELIGRLLGLCHCFAVIAKLGQVFVYRQGHGGNVVNPGRFAG